MKIAPASIEGFVRKPDPAVQAILVYGPDTGLVRERAIALAKTVLSDLKDAFRYSDFPAAVLKDEPGRLRDEAAALSLTGGRRVVAVRGVTDIHTPAFKSFLSDPIGDSLVVVEAGDLGNKSSLRKVFEDSKIAAALPCYLDDERVLPAVIRDSLKQHNLTATPDVLEWLVRNLGGDRASTRSEIEKLALYIGAPGPVSIEAAMASIGDNSALSLDDMVHATADGDHATAQRLLMRLFAEGTHPTACLRGLSRHFMRLHLAAGTLAANGGGNAEAAIKSLKPPPFFKVVPRMARQLSVWTPPKIVKALELLGNCEAECKTTGYPAEAICGRVVIQLTQSAKSSRASSAGYRS